MGFKKEGVLWGVRPSPVSSLAGEPCDAARVKEERMGSGFRFRRLPLPEDFAGIPAAGEFRAGFGILDNGSRGG